MMKCYFSTSDHSDFVQGPICLGFGVKLPFRYTVPKETVFHIPEEQCRLFVVNDVEFYDDSERPPSVEWLATREKMIGKALSKVMVVLSDCRFSQEEEEALRRGNVDNQGWQKVKIQYNLLPRVLAAINRLTFTLFSEAKNIFGAERLHNISHDFLLMEGLEAYTYFIGDNCVNFQEIAEIFDHREKNSLKAYRSGHLRDINRQLTKQTVGRINDRLAERSHTFSEYAFRARSLWGEEPEIALIFAAMALENFIVVLSRKVVFKNQDIPEERKAEILKEFTKNQGFYSLLRVFPFLVLSPEDRPTQDEMEKCHSAITLRNHLIHSTETGGGFLRHRTIGGHYEAAKACLDLIDKLMPVFRRQ